MKRKIILTLLTLIAASGCATVHQICSEPDALSKYRDYDQCYAEESASRDRRRKAFASIGKGFNNVQYQSHQSYQCSSTAIGGIISTTCY
jgi:hypothetical protein